MKHKALGLETVVFPVSCEEDDDTIMAYKKAADEAGLTIAEVGVWRNTLAADPDERQKWIDYAVRQLRMADAIGATSCVNVVGTPYGPRWDGGYRENFSRELWDMAVKMIRQIIDTARPKHTKFSIESMPWMIPSSPDECFEKLHGTIVSCHLKDIMLKPEYTFQLQECACGEGTLDINLYTKLANAENPNMPMIIEHLTTDEEYVASVRYVRERLLRTN